MQIQPKLSSFLMLVCCLFTSSYCVAVGFNNKNKAQLENTKQKKPARIVKPAQDVHPNEPQKPLDLSVPFADPEKDDIPLNPKNAENQNQQTNIFASDNKKKTRPVQVGGRLLMSPEPEVEKQKSTDGAGIVIDLKP
jgi:hypothetical protein